MILKKHSYSEYVQTCIFLLIVCTRCQTKNIVCSHVHDSGIAFIFICLIFLWIVSFDAGMIAGYILNRYPKSAPPAITPFINVVMWMMSLGLMLLLVFGVWNGTLNLLWTALYVSLGHSGESYRKHFDLFNKKCINRISFKIWFEKCKIIQMNQCLVFDFFFSCTPCGHNSFSLGTGAHLDRIIMQMGFSQANR